MTDGNENAWEASLLQGYEEVSSQVVAFAPRLASAVALLLLGWIVAHALRVLTRKLVRKLDSLFLDAASTEDSR